MIPPVIAAILSSAIFVAGQFFAPAQGATIPSLVPRFQLMSANALFNLTSTGAQLIGFATAGPLIIRVLGIDTTFAVTVALFAVCAGLVMTIPGTATVPRRMTNGSTHPVRQIWADIREGLVFIWHDRELIKAISYLTLAAVSFLLVASLGPEFITNVIGLDKEDIGYVVGPAGIGVLLGVIGVGRVTRRIPGPVLIDRAMALAGLALLLLAVSKDGLDLVWVGGEAPLVVKAATAAVLAAVLGVCNAFILVPAQTLLQERSPEHIRARIYATFFTISNTACFVPILFAAAMADVVGVVKVLVAVAVVIGGIGVSSLTRHHDWPRPRGRAGSFLARRAEMRLRGFDGKGEGISPSPGAEGPG